ncbi:MAG: preprotein translocase subunit YajC [Deltaproteobacteria bacterium]|nr:preprotein translocase subunit YajC [Deltaproteobacteria bacterium]
MFYFLPAAVAWAEDGTSVGGTGGWGMLPMIAVFGLIFYFLVIRPQQKTAKEHKKLISEIQKGDSIVLSCGIHGRIASVADDTATIEVADNVKIKVNKDVILARKAQG